MRMDLLFPKLDFSLSDQQIPMFLRLFNLAVALQLGELKNRKDNEMKTGGDPGAEAERTEKMNSTQSWAGWAWSYVPSVFPVNWEEELKADDNVEVCPQSKRTVDLGIYVGRVTWTFKWAELIRDATISGLARLRFQPFITVHMQGCYLDMVLGGVDWVNVQGGISHLTLEPTSYCLCGATEDISLYFVQGSDRTAFLDNTLYDPLSPENNNKSRVHTFHWEHHIRTMT